ncbi:MAG: arsenic resistance N-acetyltransferase ArsN2 [Armatimonadota bacterium]|nr:arsenic resistance N-acetyltransferase ArsN2 [Armatimonadota bacterium]MDR7474276.1 arsenic resistance N-acetyltransferase ArsN2 [Armatimonadota bacterium]MDR7539737.1 arsenic resistance N-acetyltransferase ArsN2 [Armatimonadota bacterium]
MTSVDGSSGTAIRPARRADYEAIVALLRDAGLPLTGVEEHLETFLVAEDRGGIAGAAGLEIYGDVALLRSVAVAAPRRGRGLGQALVAAAVTEARRRGVRELALLTTGAARFFARLGFHQVARERLDRRLFASAELGDECCASAVAMRRRLGTP